MIHFRGYDEKKLAQIVDEWERRKWDKEMLAVKETKMPTKCIMTRTKAIIFVTNRVFGLTNTGQAEKWVDFFIDAGMLEVKEEELPGLPIGFQFPFNKRDEWTNCCNELFKQGYEIKAK